MRSSVNTPAAFSDRSYFRWFKADKALHRLLVPRYILSFRRRVDRCLFPFFFLLHHAQM